MHHADLQLGDGDQLVQKLDEEHMVLLAELSPVETEVPVKDQYHYIFHAIGKFLHSWNYVKATISMQP